MKRQKFQNELSDRDKANQTTLLIWISENEFSVDKFREFESNDMNRNSHNQLTWKGFQMQYDLQFQCDNVNWNNIQTCT